jgi:hypothetical protein
MTDTPTKDTGPIHYLEATTLAALIARSSCRRAKSSRPIWTEPPPLIRRSMPSSP